MSQNYKLSVEIDAQNKKLLQNMQGSTRSVQDFKQSVATVPQTCQSANRSVTSFATNTNRAFSSTVASGDKLVGCINRIGGSVTALLAATQISQLGTAMRDELGVIQDQDVRLQALTRTSARYQTTRAYLATLADEHATSIHTLSDSYARLLTLENAQLITGEQSKAMLEGLSNASKSLGTNNAQLSQVMYGLAQGLSAGTLRAEELNQVTEPMPGLLQELDKAAGVASGGFRRMVNDGEVTSQMFAETMVKALAAYDGAAERAANNINSKSALMKNAWTETVRAFEAPLNITVGTSFDTATSTLNLMADNAETVIDLLEGAMVVAVGRSAAALTNYGVAKVNDIRLSGQQAAAEQARNVIAIKAQQSETTARLAKAQAEMVAAAAEERSAQIRVQTAMGSASSLSAEQALSAAKARGVAASQVALAAERQLTAGRVALTAASQRATVASRAMGVAMGVLGGPVGVVMLAATAIGYWATSSKQAVSDSDELSRKVKELAGDFSKLTDNQRELFTLQERNKISGQEQQITELQNEIDLNQRLIAEGENVIANRQKRGWAVDDLVEKQKRYQQRLLEAKSAQDSARQAIEQSRKTIEKLSKATQSTTEQTKANTTAVAQQSSELTKQANKLEAQLSRQIALYGETSNVAKVRYEMEHGELQKLSPEHQKLLLQRAQELDNLNKQKEAQKNLQTATVARLEAEAQAKQQLRGQTVNIGTAANNALMSPEQQEIAEFEQNMATLQAYRLQLHSWEYAEQVRINQAIQAEQQRHAKALEDIQTARLSSLLTNSAQMFDGFAGIAQQLAGEQSGVYKAMFIASKAFAIADSIIKIQQGIANAAALPFPANIPAMASVAASTASIVSTIQSVNYSSSGNQAHAGIDRVPGGTGKESNWPLVGGERVYTNQSANQIDQMAVQIGQMTRFMQTMTTAATRPAANGGAISAPIINIHNAPAGTTTKQTTHSDGTLQIDTFIAAAVDAAEDRIAGQLETGTGRAGRAVRRRA